jgi:hypothetical protein
MSKILPFVKEFKEMLKTRGALKPKREYLANLLENFSSIFASLSSNVWKFSIAYYFAIFFL